MNLEPRIESYLSLAEAKSRYTDSLATVDALIDKPTWDDLPTSFESEVEPERAPRWENALVWLALVIASGALVVGCVEWVLGGLR